MSTILLIKMYIRTCGGLKENKNGVLSIVRDACTLNFIIDLQEFL